MTKVCLDPGHYGKTYNKGAASGYYESYQMWKLYKYVKKYLETLYGIEVVSTRTSINANPGLTTRGKKAKDCECFISLHTNAELTKMVRRCTAICLADRSDTKVDEKSNKLAQLVAKAVADCMNVEYKITSRLSSSDKDGNGKKDDNYYGVLHGAYLVGVPAIIMEHSFHTNKETASWLMKTANLKKLAKAEAKAIATYCGITKKISNAPVSVPAKPDSSNDAAEIKVAQYKNAKYSGKYVVSTNGARLALRAGAGSDKTFIKYLNNGSEVMCYGYYNTDGNGTKWLYVQVRDANEVGYMHSGYLKKV